MIELLSTIQIPDLWLVWYSDPHCTIFDWSRKNILILRKFLILGWSLCLPRLGQSVYISRNCSCRWVAFHGQAHPLNEGSSKSQHTTSWGRMGYRSSKKKFTWTVEKILDQNFWRSSDIFAKVCQGAWPDYIDKVSIFVEQLFWSSLNWCFCCF